MHQTIMGGTFIAARYVLLQTDPLAVAFFRYCISATILCSIAIRISKNGKSIPITSADKKKIIILGLVIIMLNQTLYLVGQKFTTAAHGGILFATTPVFVYLMAMRHLGEKWSLKKGLGILLTVAGAALIFGEDIIDFSDNILLGNIIILIAVVAWGYYTVYGKPLVQKYGAFRITAYSIGAGAIIYFPIGIWRAVTADLSNIDAYGWWGLLYISIMTSVIGYSIWYWFLKYMEASRAAVLVNIQPIIAAILGYYILGESISGLFILGGMIIIAGVTVTQLVK
ncbi:MAG: DMT family transporter [candidate division Zixibacteria bacterium]